MSAKVVLVAACALIDADGRVLIAERPAGKSMAGLWEFPGGKVDPGERPEDALIRELKEELGIVVNEACLAPLTFASHSYEDFHLLMPLYVCRRWEGMVTPARGPEARLGPSEPAEGLSDAARGRSLDLAPDDAAVMPMLEHAESDGKHDVRGIQSSSDAGIRCGRSIATLSRRAAGDEEGGTAIEYALIASGIGAAVAATV